MFAYCRLLRDSGVGKQRAVLSVLFAYCSLFGKTRRGRLEWLIMQRKEVCEIKDAIIAYAAEEARNNPLSGSKVSRSQLEDRLRTDFGRGPQNKAFGELVRDGILKSVPVKMQDPVYMLTPKPYVSKTTRLAARLAEMGVYARAVKEQKPYHIPPEYHL
jgi:hypothetical protein